MSFIINSYGFTPKPFAHWDFSDLTTITKDGSNRVSQVDDKSGNGNHLVQATGGSQPLWVDNGQNGLDIIDFVGDRFLEYTGGTVPQPLTILYVGEITSDNTFHIMIGWKTTGTAVYFTRPVTDRLTLDANTALFFAEAGLVNTWRLSTLTMNTTSSSIRIDGTTKVSGDIGAGSFGGGIMVQNNGETIYGLKKVAEIIVYKQILSDTFRDAKEAELLAKWFP